MYLQLQTVAHVRSSHHFVVGATSRGLCRDRVDRLGLGGTIDVRFLRRLIVVLIAIVLGFSSCIKVCWWPATVHNLLATRARASQSRIQIQLRLLLVYPRASEVSFE